MGQRAVRAAVVLALGAVAVSADDWPEHRGKGRAALWNETGIVERFPDSGLKVLWRTPVNRGYSGPAVANSRVFLMDFIPEQEGGVRGIERALALDEQTGRVLWTHEWPAVYGSLSWPNGPRATPTVDGDRVYFQGAMGHLAAVRAATGEVLWNKDYMADFKANRGSYGFASPPIIDGDLLICVVGAEPEGKIVAFDKLTGREVWRALPNTEAIGVSAPILVEYGGARQLIYWHPEAVVSLDPATGKVHWRVPFKSQDAMNPSTPIFQNGRLFVSTFYNGSAMIVMDDRTPAAALAWKGASDSEIETDGLHAVIGTPVMQGDHIYGNCSFGQLRCLRMDTGERVWESQELTQERARWATAFFVRQGERYFVNTDRGDLVIAKLSPQGYEEVSRTFLIAPTTMPGNRRKLTFVNWSHPAYANRHIYARNDHEIICATLAAADYE
ncbi:MAG: pyrrolo-quinoline quinone [Acidimicrobiia bacterium]|nr:pyrrolo-quinoline quinone [Acidimicrobiia bacterium]